VIRVNASSGSLEVALSEDELDAREVATPDLRANAWGMGRELFGVFRNAVSGAESGGSVFATYH